MRINRISLHLFITFCAIFIFDSSAFAQMKIGIIDVNAIIASLKESKEVDAQLQAKKREWEQQIEQMRAEGERLEKEYQSQRLLLSEEKRQEKILQLQDLQQKINQFANEKFNQVDGEYFRLRLELMQPLLDKVQVQMEKIGVEEGYDYIFDVSTYQLIVFASEDVRNNHDLTLRIIEAMGGDAPPAANNSNSKNEGK